MKTTIVWRLEDKAGNGIYRGTDYYYDAVTKDSKDPLNEFDRSNSIERHPNPYNDPELGFDDIAHDEYSFGFASISQMRQWVYKSKWRKNLAEMGVLLNKYEVDIDYYRRSPFQAVFNKKFARLLESRRPDYADI